MSNMEDCKVPVAYIRTKSIHRSYTLLGSSTSEIIPTLPVEKKPYKRKKPNSLKIELSPVVPVLYFQEELFVKAAECGLKVSKKYTMPKRRSRNCFPLTYANNSWFYNMTSRKTKDPKARRPFRSSNQKLMPSRRLLLAAHKDNVGRMKKLTEMYEVEYVADFKMIWGQRFYLVKWVNWPEEANTWEASRNLSCRMLIKEFHEDFLNQLMKHFAENGISWNKLLLGQNGIHETTYTQRLFDAIPKGFKYQSTYGTVKADYRNQLKLWQDVINESSNGCPYVVVENEVDMELPPQNFTYISKNIAGKGVNIPDDPIVACECEGDCGTSRSCSCISGASQKTKSFYENKLIKIKPGRPIYECNSRCTCGPDCPTRVVQNGSKYTLAIFRTPNGKGWGVKALQFIPRGAFVIEYIGEVITNAEAEQRGLEYDNEGITYLFDLDFHETENPMTVDATRYGNVSHFINHSCAPNLQVYNVFIDNIDPSLPRIALFARRNILVNEELTFDYQMTGATGDSMDDASDQGSYQFEPDGDTSSPRQDEEMIDRTKESDRLSEVSNSSNASSILKKKCLCNAKNCRGWLVM